MAIEMGLKTDERYHEGVDFETCIQLTFGAFYLFYFYCSTKNTKPSPSEATFKIYAGFGTGISMSDSQLQSFYRGYGSILSTFFASIIQSTRGCSQFYAKRTKCCLFLRYYAIVVENWEDRVLFVPIR